MPQKNKELEILLKLTTQGNFEEAKKQLEILKAGHADAAKSGTGAFATLSRAWQNWTSMAMTSAGALRKAWLTALGPISALIIVFNTLKSMFGFIFTAVSNYRKAQEETNKAVRESSDALNKATAHMQKYADVKGIDGLNAAIKAHTADLEALSKKHDEIKEKIGKAGQQWWNLFGVLSENNRKLMEQLPLLAQAAFEAQKEIRAKEASLELTRKQEEAEKKRLSAVESVTQRIKELTLGETELKVYNLEKQLQKYEEAGVSKVEIERLRTLELARIHADADAKTEQDAERKAQAIEQVERELNQKMASLSDEKLQGVLSKNASEEQSEIKKLDKKLLGEKKYDEMVGKIHAYRLAKDRKDTEADAKIKQETTWKTLETSLEAISILNDMESGHTKAQAVRAKIILALEKAIAIARIWSAPSLGPWDVGLKVAQTAVVAAQFAQQSKAINQAQEAASQASSTSLSVSTDIGNGQTITETSSSGGTGSSPVISGGSGASAPSSGGGEVAGAIIYVGGVNLDLAVDRLDISNVRLVARELAEIAKAGVIEGVQLAVALRNVGNKNALVAV